MIGALTVSSLTIAIKTLTKMTQLALPSSDRRASGAKPFARVRVLTDLEEASAAWSELAAVAAATPYQAMAFARAWLETLGKEEGASAHLILAQDSEGRPAALLPLCVPRGALRKAAFIGGAHGNANLGLFREPHLWSGADIADMLLPAGRGRVDLYALKTMPASWNGIDNPLAKLDVIDAPAPTFSTSLSDDFEKWFSRHTSKDARKKWRRKRQGLENAGPVAFLRAEDAAQAEAILQAFLAQRAERAKQGLPNAYATPSAIAFLRRLAGLDAPTFAPTLRLYALRCGEVTAATFGALDQGGHLSGVVTSFSRDPALARFSPGELLLHDVIADAFARARRSLDLGVGDGRYKREICETEIPLVEAYVPITPAGAVAAKAERWRSGAKRRLKANPRAMDIVRLVRGMLARRRSGAGIPPDGAI